jgi:hypothetical protein
MTEKGRLGGERKRMDEKRKGEIAIAVEKYRLRRTGIFLKNDSKREIGNLAKECGISIDEVMEFFKDIVTEMTQEFFAKKEK